MNNWRLFGIGIVMAVVVMFAVSLVYAKDIPTGKEAIVWLEPDPSSGLYHHDVTVQLKVNTSVYLSCWADWIYFNTSCVNITSGVCGDTFTTDCEFHHWGNYIRTAGMDPDFCEQTTGEILLFTYTLQCNCTNMSACTSQLYHHPDHQEMGDCNIETVNTEWVHGNFSCTPTEPSPTLTPPPLPMGVPEFSPLGLLALIGLLSAVLAVATVGKRKRWE